MRSRSSSVAIIYLTNHSGSGRFPVKELNRCPSCPSPASTIPSLPWRTSKPCCGRTARRARTAARPTASTTLKGKSTKPGVRKCGHCLKLFTVTVGTVFESSHVPLNKWLQAVHLLCSRKKGISSHQLHRTLEVTYKTAWFMSHRIREAMRDGTLGAARRRRAAPLRSTRRSSAARRACRRRKGGPSHKHAVLALVERGGKVRSVHVEELTKAEVGTIVRENVARETRLMTDEAKHYRAVGQGVRRRTAASTTRSATTSTPTIPRSTRTRSKGCSRSSSAG